MKKRSRSPLVIALPYLASLLGIIIINWFVFQYVFHQNYLIWYITNGTLIGIIVSFVASIWEGLDSRTKLLSAHPGWYIQGCFGLIAAFFASLAASWERDPDYEENESTEDLNAKFNFRLDWILEIVLKLVMSILTFAWLIIVAPLNYFITILTGSIARTQLLGKYKRAIIIEREDRLTIDSISRKDNLPEQAVDVSIAAKPFAITQAITALVLFIAKELLVA